MYSGRRDRPSSNSARSGSTASSSQGSGVPRLPIIEPERVPSPPLTIPCRTSIATARRARDDRRHARATSSRSSRAAERDRLFRGRAWIAVDELRRWCGSPPSQTGLRGPIVASEQADDFEQVETGVWLLARSDVRQTYEGAAYRTPIHRVLSMTRTRSTRPISPPGARRRSRRNT